MRLNVLPNPIMKKFLNKCLVNSNCISLLMTYLTWQNYSDCIRMSTIGIFFKNRGAMEICLHF